MPQKWTGDLVGLMHTNNISQQKLAEELGVTNRYVSMVLNSHKEPAGAKERFSAALDRIIQRRGASGEILDIPEAAEPRKEE